MADQADKFTVIYLKIHMLKGMLLKGSPRPICVIQIYNLD